MNKKIPKNVVIDVDGVLSTGQIIYNQKVFQWIMLLEQ